MEKAVDKLEDGEKEQMEDFVRGLLKTMPLSSLTQRIVREKYRSQYKKEKPLSGKQSEMLRNVVVEVARAELPLHQAGSTPLPPVQRAARHKDWRWYRPIFREAAPAFPLAWTACASAAAPSHAQT